MSTGYKPPDPMGNSNFSDWAQHQNALVNRERRIVRTPDTLTTITPDGTIHRPMIQEGGGTGGGGDRPVWL